MMARYLIGIHNHAGELKTVLFDFKTLSIIDSRNDVGSWAITSQGRERAPFEAGDYIIVERDGVVIYCGILKELTEEYHKYSDSWFWKASGCNLNEFLKWKYIYPSVVFIDSEDWMRNRYREYTNAKPSDIISDIILKDVAYNSGYSRTPSGIEIVFSTTQTRIPSGYQERTIDFISYRFDNVFDTIMGLASDSDLSVIPFASGIDNTVVSYMISANYDLSDSVVFSSELDQVDVFKRVTKAPDATHVIESFNSDQSDIYKYYSAEGIGTPSDWERSGQARELFIEPKEEDFNSTFTKARLTELCQTEAKSRTKETEGFEVTLNMTNCPFVYGITIPSSPPFDYTLGDTVGVMFQGTKYTARVNGIEFDVSYGQEKIKPTIGVQMKGKFNQILANLSNLSQSVNKKQNSQR